MPVGNITQLTENKIADQNTISELRERCDALEWWVSFPRARDYLTGSASMKLRPSVDEIVQAYRRYKEESCQNN
jgi:hypothetical protein